MNDLPTTSSFLRPRLVVFATFALLAACSSGDPAGPGEDASGATDDHGEGTGQIAEGFSGGTVADAAASTCGTASVKGLSFQIIEEGNCIEPGAFSPLTLPANATAGSGVFLFIQKPARDKLQSIVKANPGKSLTINSMLRTAAQQYLLYNWYQTGRCGISLAAKPGNSNHESGLAIDVQEYSSWRSIFEGNGFRWLGASDPWHYDWVGAGAKDHRGLDVLAFQRLWNRNNPNDKIAEDGSWGPATESRMRKSPAGGFAVGAVCNAAPPEPTCQAVFSDICGSAHQPAIEWMAKEGLSSGCGGGKFCPDETVSRAQMAAFLTAALDLPPGPDAFTDDEGSIHEDAINAVAAAGITTGCGGTNYCPDAQVTREQMATFLVRAFKLDASGEDLFTDDETSIHEADINALGAAGVTSGCGGTNYCPVSPVTRGQMATFLHRAMQ
ncbi:S-layer homology domain-containing protein [Polyangium spumosum]|uniref:SLH domain-containing protein n=1 Tax=Polyangium spumosum TaxID=889282 RepID=A0A6N7PRW0_9BACT|nr:S-layer homology domain-containing protein [Polyangium spumosum]MRG94743.1 hypothetical protein [Polyangium spumosum]